MAKLDSAGTLLWNSFLGGPGDDAALSLDVLSSMVYIAGWSNQTWGTPVREYTAGWDNFTAAMQGDGQLVWTTFLGGSGTDQVGGISVSEGGLKSIHSCERAPASNAR